MEGVRNYPIKHVFGLKENNEKEVETKKKKWKGTHCLTRSERKQVEGRTYFLSIHAFAFLENDEKEIWGTNNRKLRYSHSHSHSLPHCHLPYIYNTGYFSLSYVLTSKPNNLFSTLFFTSIFQSQSKAFSSVSNTWICLLQTTLVLPPTLHCRIQKVLIGCQFPTMKYG